MYPPGTEPQGSQNPSAACPLPHISPSFLLFSFFLSISLFFSIYTTPPSEPTEAVKGKRKKYCSHGTKKRADLKDSYLSIKSALRIFSDTFSPLTGAVAF